MKNNKGITLVALIITIIVMLILVAVTVSIVINSDLIGTAQETANAWNEANDDLDNMKENKDLIDGSDKTLGNYLKDAEKTEEPADGE